MRSAATLLLLAGCTYVTRAEYDARLDPDRDGAPWPADCAPDDPEVFPGAVEICGNGVDEDCTGGDGSCTETDADADADADSDTDTDADTDVPTGDTGCAGPDGDGDGVADVCDGCPTEPSLTAPVDVPIDLDGDGFGGAAQPTCAPPAVVPRAGDCDDGDVFVRPTAPEVPGNTVDESCDGVVTCFLDADGDGLGDIEGPADGNGDGDCADAGEATVATDCDDGDPAVGAGACADQPPIAVLSVFPLVLEAGGTVTLSGAFATDAEDAPGTLDLRFDFDGDGTFDTAFANTTEAAGTYATAGVFEPVLEVRDSAGQLSWARGLVVVAEPGALLVVDTDADDNDPEPFGGPYTNGLSLREALALANDPGPATITFADRFALAPASPLPTVTGADTTVVGVPNLVLEGGAAGGTGLDLQGDRATVAALHLRGWATALAFGGAQAVARGCELEANGEAFDLQADDVRIVDGWVHDNAAVQIRVARRATIEHTRVAGGSTGILVDGGADGTTIRGVTVADVAGDCVVLDTASGGADDVVITDATIAGCTDGIDFANNADSAVLENTIVANHADAGVRNGAFTGNSPDTVLWFDNGGGNCVSCGTGGNAVFADPRFVAPALRDYRLRAGSPAADAGAATGFDRNGAAPGTSDGPPDIGAHER